MPKCLFPKWCWEKECEFTKRACQAGRLSVSISNTGDVRPCSHNPIIYGNIFEEELETIWNKMSVYRDGIVPVFCKDCPSVSICNGGCRTNSLALTGSLFEKDPLALDYLELPDKKTEINFDDGSVIYFKGKLRWREELQGKYSLSSKKNSKNLVVMNLEMFKFVFWLEKNLPMTIGKLKEISSSHNEESSFKRIISYLFRKEFICLEKET